MSKNSDLIKTIESFTHLKVLVLGDAMLDCYLRGTSERLSQEAPVPIVDIGERNYLPGGAANTAINLRSLGARVEFLGAIGDDEAGSMLIQSLEERQVSCAHIIRVPGRLTLSKQRILAGSQILLRFDQGSTGPLDSESEHEMIKHLEMLFYEADAVVISDYDYGAVTAGVLDALERLQRETPRLIAVDSKRLPFFRHLNITAVKPNYEQVSKLLGLEKLKSGAERLGQVSEHGRKVLDLSGAQIAAITLDRNGAVIFCREAETYYRTYAVPQSDSQAAGAGDTFISALTVGLAAGAHIEHASEMASAAASIVVSKNGTAACFAEELKDYFSTHEKFIEDVFQLALRVATYRRMGRRIVFTNGCFDILHRGHIAYLNRAKSLGDVLIVGLNSDHSIRSLKGSGRPINSLEDRAQILAALSCVDHIVPFEESTPHELIRITRPDVFVKGGDYSRETLPEASLVEQLGGRVEILPYVESYSTTSVIEKIRALLEG